MATRRRKPPPPPPAAAPPPSGAVLGLLILIVVALVAFGAYQLVVTRQLDKYLIAGLVVLALAFAGYGGDRLLERLTERFR